MPFSPPPIAELLAELQRVFAALGLRWFLFGAQAAILYGVARLSADVDITLDLGDRSSRDVVDALAAAGFELRVADAAGFVEATRVLPFVHRASRMPVDVVLAGPGLEDQFFAGTPTERVVGEARVPVVSAEDLVAMKVLAGRARDVGDPVDDDLARSHRRAASRTWHRERLARSTLLNAESDRAASRPHEAGRRSILARPRVDSALIAAPGGSGRRSTSASRWPPTPPCTGTPHDPPPAVA